MKNKKWYITGDTHGGQNLLDRIKSNNLPRESNLIILGDVGINFYLNEKEEDIKEKISNLGISIFCVRGNHDCRPSHLKNICLQYVDFIEGEVFIEKKYPNIYYLKDGVTYTFNNKKCLVIGGAYSVDKWDRIFSHNIWFEDEQLSGEEMTYIQDQIRGEDFDCVLTHTCPFNMQPTDLFIKGMYGIDTSMEVWMMEIERSITYRKWYFGHYHENRKISREYQLLFDEVEEFK